MNAPANIRVPAAIRVDPSPAERAHRRTISIHCPNCDEVEMAARCDLAAMRDQASAGVMRACDPAAVILGEVVKLAAAAVYAPLPASQLLRIRSALGFTIEAARAVERVNP